ncbi:hypothetical protein D4740_00255 [Actinomyces sp. 2119]|uniref:CT398-like coiled coil hairpin domain-containing protein n=1 Tax=Actinomyces lilanjuaniae TaxID=2321394 RepID=A0ABM6Z3T6_9ACTO|nr:MULTISPECIES: hypothetical protein [Actinomyces]AYD89708.1 hypothetical protein D5R93_05965 [Actinomyces lilanjuaniae]RJF44670.1 hypothetical protein D4740_00255 [Actinomyces sp. 2119]
MRSAPITQQRMLIDLQSLDSRLARLRHERSRLPVLQRIEATVERLKTNRREALLAQAALAEARQEAERSEEEVAQVVRRAQALRERLHSGETGARDLSAIQHEIDHLGQRQQVLEDRQVSTLEALESAQAQADRLAQEEQDIRAAGRQLTAERDERLAQLDQERAAVEDQRSDVVGGIDAELLAEYEEVRSRTGGLGAVALRAGRIEGGSLEISPQEYARFASAPEDAVLRAEENDVIVVRMDI